MLLVFYFAFSKRWWSCLVTEVAAVIIHPSNIFALIILIPIFIAGHSSGLVISWKRTKILGILAVISAVMGIALLVYANHIGFSGILTGNVAHRIINLSGWLGLLSAFGDLISGVTVYRAIVTPVYGYFIGHPNNSCMGFLTIHYYPGVLVFDQTQELPNYCATGWHNCFSGIAQYRLGN